jgi:CDP-glycerol glycerophosphotransferase (TagB/SpsB family)
VDGAVLLDDGVLEKSGLTLYGVIARAAGLITDVSSVGTDFLVLDRPIGYYFPDRASYLANRGVWPDDALEHLPGPLLDGPKDIAEFARQVLEETEEERAQRHASMEWMTFVSETNAALAFLRGIANGGATAFARSLANDLTTLVHG